MLYNRVIPSYDNDKKEKKQEVINADDPKNRDEILRILHG